MIQDIEEFRPELNIEVLRNTRNTIVLEKGKIEIREARTNQTIAARVSQSRGWSGKCKAFCLDVMHWIAGMDG